MTSAIPTLVLPDGRRIELDVDVVLGRAPAPPDGWPAARSISVSVPTISKTHVLVGHDASGVWLIDLHSSNGSEVLDDSGMSQKAEPGQRLNVPNGSHIRVGTDTIITIDLGDADTGDDLDRTVVVRAAPAVPSPVTPDAAAAAVDWASISEPDPVAPSIPEPSPPTESQPPAPIAAPGPGVTPPPPVQPPPPPPVAAQPAPNIGADHTAPVSYSPAPAGAPSYGTPGTGGPQFVPAQQPPAGRRWSPANFIGALALLLWSGVALLVAQGWVPDVFLRAIDGRLIGFFAVPDRVELERREYFSFVNLPDALSFLSWAAVIGPVLAIVMAIVALVVQNAVVRWTLAGLIAVPMVLNFGFLVTLGFDSFDIITENLDRFIPWFVLPAIGIALLLWPSARSGSAPSQQQDLFYAPGQQPGPPFSGPAGPSYS